MSGIKEPIESYETDEDGNTYHVTEYGPEDEFLLAQGWEAPNYTQVPNQLLGHWNDDGDYILGQMTDMGEAELKVALVLCRLTFGFHRDGAAASLSWLEKATGLSRQGVLNGISALTKRGLFIKDKSRDGRNLWRKVHGGVVNEVDQIVNEVDQTSQRGRPNKERLKKVLNNPPLKKRAVEEPHPTSEPEYVDLDEDGFPVKEKTALVKYIERRANRRLTNNQESKLSAGVPFHNPQYPSPATLFTTDPEFEAYIDDKIAWALGGKDGQRKTTGRLVNAIRNYDEENFGWLNHKQKIEEEARASPATRFRDVEPLPDEPDAKPPTQPIPGMEEMRKQVLRMKRGDA